MAKPRLTIRPIEKTISIPETLVAQVDIHLYSQLEGRVPHGAWSRYIKRLIERDMEDQQLDREEGGWPDVEAFLDIANRHPKGQGEPE